MYRNLGTDVSSACCRRAARSLRPLAHREFSLVRRQHSGHGDGGADPGGGGRLADVRASPTIRWRWGWWGWPRRRPSSPSRSTPGTWPTSAIAGGSRSRRSSILFACARRRWPWPARSSWRAGGSGRLDPLDDLRGDRRLRRRAQLSPAGAQRPRRRAGAAPALPERRRLAHRHLAGRRGHRPGDGRRPLRLGRRRRRPTASPPR